MSCSKKIIIIAGGSGGHVFPGLAVAQYLMNNGYDVVWIGTANHMEAKLVPQYGIDIKFIRIQGWYGKKWYMKLLVILVACVSIYQTVKIIKYWKPDIILSMGGYVAASSGVATWICKVPLIIHEQNRVIGLTNRFLSIFAKKVLQGFPNTVFRAKTVGNPIRQTILSIPSPIKRWENRFGPLRILVIGGSKGAHILNVVIPAVVITLSNQLIVWHQTGEQDLKHVRCAYWNAQNNKHRIVPFIDDIAQAYEWADLVISRSGALTVSEIAAVGLPAIFVPFEHHQDRQQYFNAVPLVEVGAAKIVIQKEFTIDRVSAILDGLDRRKLFDMAQSAQTLAVSNATEQVVYEMLQHLKK